MIFKRELSRHNAVLLKRVATLERRLKVATECLTKISEGSFEVQTETTEVDDEEGRNFNATLLKMSNKLQGYAQKEKERAWIAEGISKFMGLTQGDSRLRGDFYNKILALLVVYTDANQGGLFNLNDDDADDMFLEMSACYAYGKKRYAENKIAIGDGLLGQCYLEGQTIRFTDVPKSYLKITSGLGEAVPGFLLLVPMKFEGKVWGVVELASFTQMEPYKVEFIERIAENVASVCLNIRNAKRTTDLFEESRDKARILEEKEESLRQNIRELMATQEEMKRSQKELHQQTSYVKFILDNIPFPVFVKDEEGKYTLANKAEAKLFNLPDKELLGKDDSNFVSSDEEWRVIQESDARVLASNEPVELPAQHFTTHKGTSYVFKTTKIPFINSATEKKNILGVSIDLTEKYHLERKLLRERSLTCNNILINIAGRQRMLSQKMGFHAEIVVKGKRQHILLLKDAMELHDHSLNVIRYGGMPKDVACEDPLPEAEDELLPYLNEIDNVWKPFKKAVENIVQISIFGNFNMDDEKSRALERNISVIESNGELLLELNNDLMLVCMTLHQAKLEEVY